LLNTIVYVGGRLLSLMCSDDIVRAVERSHVKGVVAPRIQDNSTWVGVKTNVNQMVLIRQLFDCSKIYKRGFESVCGSRL
jgi:hypothetical protein